MSISGAIAGVAAMGFTMCVLAALVTIFIAWVVPPPGTKDVASEMPWTRLAPFSAAHGALRGSQPNARRPAQLPPRADAAAPSPAPRVQTTSAAT